MRLVTHIIAVLQANILNLLVSCSFYSLVLSTCVAHLGISIYWHLGLESVSSQIVWVDLSTLRAFFQMK